MQTQPIDYNLGQFNLDPAVHTTPELTFRDQQGQNVIQTPLCHRHLQISYSPSNRPLQFAGTHNALFVPLV